MGTSVQNLRFFRPSVKCREVTHQKSCLLILHQKIWKGQDLPLTSMTSRGRHEWTCSISGKLTKTYCSEWEILRICTYTAVEISCGKEAAESEVNGVMDHHFNPSKFFGGCPTGGHRQWIMTGCVVGAFVVLVVVFVVVAGRIYRKKKTKSRTPAENTFV